MSSIPGMRRVSIRPNEILLAGTPITIDAKQALDKEATQRAVGVRGVEGAVSLLSAGKRVVWRPAGELPLGLNHLVVDGLVARTGRKVSTGGEIPFFVARSQAKVSRSVAIESMVRLRPGKMGMSRLSIFENFRGSYIDVIKGVNRKTGAPKTLAFDHKGNPVDVERRFAAMAKAQARKFGSLHEDLHARLEKSRKNQVLPVAIWLHVDEKVFDVERPKRGDLRRAPAFVKRQRKEISKAVSRVSREIKKMGGEGVAADALAPVVHARLKPDAIRELQARDEVAGVYLYDPTGIDDLDNSMAIANSDDVHSIGPKGSGVRVAVWESGPHSTTHLTITGRFKTNPSNSDHSTHVHAIIKNKQSGKPKGHARSCKLYSANDKDLDALRWAVKDKKCTVINQSFHRSAEPKSSGLSYDDIYKDWLALNYPWPTICQAAGNFWSGDSDNINPPSSEYVNHKGFNSLAVGNHNDTATGMSSSSVFRNPASPHGDRELPEISANGTSVTAAGLTKSGTSMASPACAGVAALLQSTNTTLKSWPEGCRALLLAGATRNVVDNTWWQDVVAGTDASDGSGAVNALESYYITKKKRSRNASATRRGWDVGSLTSSDFKSNKESKFVYKVKVPSGFWGPRHVKVAVAWTSKINRIFGIPIASNLTVDLDLKVYDSGGNQVGYSGSWDNSYEIAEFSGQPGETYTIRIRRWSGSDKVYYGIAWTVTGGLSIVRRLLRAVTP